MYSVTPAQYLSPSVLTPLADNPRKITRKDLNILADSIRENGYYPHRPLALEQQGSQLVVLDGNQRLKAFKRLRLKMVPCVIYSNLTDAERAEIILRGNINNGTWDADMLSLDPQFAQMDLAAMGLQIDLPALDTPSQPATDPRETRDTDSTAEEHEAMPYTAGDMDFYRRMQGDFLYDSDNEYNIPNLLLSPDTMPDHLLLPLAPWGAESRNKHGISTYHFYVEDYRFERLFKDPMKLLQSGCKHIVEPNCSIHDQTPVAMALFLIYKKRYLARYLQECGIKVWVDLNVSSHFARYNRLGIPHGYNAFFTRGTGGRVERLQFDLRQAQEISGLEHPNMVVYAGGDDIRRFCQAHRLLYLNEYMTAKEK